MTRRRLQNTLRTTGIIVVSLLLLVGISGSVASRYFKREILRKLPALAAKAMGGLYKVSVEDLRINIFTGEVTVYGLRLNIDSAVLAKKRAAQELPTMLVNLYVPKVRLRSVNWNNALKEKELSCRKVFMDAPDISVVLTGSSYRKGIGRKSEQTINDVHVLNAVINSPHLVVTGSETSPFNFEAGGGEIKIHDWKYIPGKPDSLRFFYAASAVVNVDSLDYQSGGSFYVLASGPVHFNTDSSSLSMLGLAFAPVITYDSVYKLLGHRGSIFNFHTENVTLRAFDWQAFIYKAAWRAEQLSLLSPSLEIFYSKVPPPAVVARNNGFPDDILQRLRHHIYLPYATISNGSVIYRCQDDRTLREGDILFNNLDGIAVHISNDSAIRPSPAYLLANGTLFDRSPFSAALGFNLHDTDGHFRITGALTNLRAEEVVQPVEVLALASVKSLALQRMDMTVQGNKDSAEGDFAFRYDKLRVRLQHFDTLSSRVKGRNILSFIANNVFLNPANPMPGAPFRVVHPTVYRDEGQAFFSFIWKLIFSGIQQTAIRDKEMLDRFRERRAKHLVKKLQKKTSAALNAAIDR